MSQSLADSNRLIDVKLRRFCVISPLAMARHFYRQKRGIKQFLVDISRRVEYAHCFVCSIEPLYVSQILVG
jgi:hypothetical protein